jgi:hypothetical protein
MWVTHTYKSKIKCYRQLQQRIISWVLQGCQGVFQFSSHMSKKDLKFPRDRFSKKTYSSCCHGVVISLSIWLGADLQIISKSKGKNLHLQLIVCAQFNRTPFRLVTVNSCQCLHWSSSAISAQISSSVRYTNQDRRRHQYVFNIYTGSPSPSTIF